MTRCSSSLRFCCNQLVYFTNDEHSRSFASLALDVSKDLGAAQDQVQTRLPASLNNTMQILRVIEATNGALSLLGLPGYYEVGLACLAA